MPINSLSSSPFPTLVFDLDGTLADTAIDLGNALNFTLIGAGMPPVPQGTLSSIIGRGGRAMIAKAFALAGHSVEGAELEALYTTFVAHYRAHIADESHLYEGVQEAIANLQQKGWRFAVCTNKFEAPARQLLEALDYAEAFETICGQDTFTVCKPHPDALRQTIVKAGGDPTRAVMVGDSETDILTAQAAGIPVIAVDFGYSEAPVASYKPTTIISHYAALVKAVEALGVG